MKGGVKWNELSEQEYFRTFAMCHEYEILQHLPRSSSLRYFFLFKGVERFYCLMKKHLAECNICS